MVRKRRTRREIQALAAELTAFRGERTKKEVAAVLGVGERTYHRFEKAERCPPDSLMLLVRCLQRTGGA